MRGNVPPQSADCAVVNLSKKKNRTPKKLHNQQNFSSGVPMYDMTQHNLPNTNAKSSVVSSEVADLYSVVSLNKNTSIQSSETNKDRLREETFYDTIRRESPSMSDEETDKSELKQEKQNIRNVAEGDGISSSKWRLSFFVAAVITVSLVFLALVIVVVILFLKVSSLETANRENDKIKYNIVQASEDLQNKHGAIENRAYELAQSAMNCSMALQYLEHQFNSANTSLDSLKDSLENLTSILTSLLDEVQRKVFPLHDFYNSSCSDIAGLNLSYASGNYIVRSSTGVLRSVYCDMNRTFGGNSTGWMRVAELNVNNCPPGLRPETANPVDTCVVIEDNAGCTEIVYPVYNIKYTNITGQVRGYQIRSCDGFVSNNRIRPRPPSSVSLSHNYLDGVSISTNGSHVWSFAAGCNCMNTRMKPAFIDHHYSCGGEEFYTGGIFPDLLWMSQQCGENSTWFYRRLAAPTATDIRVRICRDQSRMDEDLAVKTLELYIQ